MRLTSGHAVRTHLPGVTVVVGRSPSRSVPSTPRWKMLALSVSDAAEDVVAVIRRGTRLRDEKPSLTAELADAICRVAGRCGIFFSPIGGICLDALAPPAKS